jgi:hypothetical protein
MAAAWLIASIAATLVALPRQNGRRPRDGRSFRDLALGLPDGWCCPAHSTAIEAVISEGGLEDPDNDLRSGTGLEPRWGESI